MMMLRTLLASAAVVLIGGAVFAAATDRFQAFTTETARRVAIRQHPVEIPAVTLETQTGELINLGELRGRWLLVDFIYTRCPSYCVALGSEFAQLQDRLAQPLAQDSLQLLSISFDPVHDTRQALASYLQRARHRGTGWNAARPVSAAGLHRIEQSFGLTVIPDTFGGYTHNVSIHLIDPRGRLVDIVDPGSPEHVAKWVLGHLGG